MSRSITLAALAAAALTLIGLALRIAYLDHQSLFADELSTHWVSTKLDLSQAVSAVQTDQEITPPLYYVLAWATVKLGDATVWLRLPSLLAGVAAIPLAYLLGLRTVGRAAALLAAALVALSPFLIFYSTEARAYMTVLALVLGSTIALLAALDTGRRRWWAAYAALSCAAMYAHYTAAFVLVAQALWALWAHSESRRALLVSNGLAALAFLPWLPSFIDDTESPTTATAGTVWPFRLDTALEDLGVWSLSIPGHSLESLPGTVPLVLLTIGLGIAIGWLATRAADGPGSGFRPPPRLALVVVLAVSAPLGASVYSLIANDVFGARNLIASWPGFALLLGALLSAVAMPLRVVSALLVLSVLGFGALRMLGDEYQRPDYEAVAEFIEGRGEPTDPVVDRPLWSGGPRTGLEVALSRPDRVLRIGAPPRTPGPPDFEHRPSPEPQASVARRAIRRARGGRLFVAVPDIRPPATAGQGPLSVFLKPRVLRMLDSKLRLVDSRSYRGTIEQSVYRYEDAGGGER